MLLKSVKHVEKESKELPRVDKLALKMSAAQGISLEGEGTGQQEAVQAALK
jgi:hypothetical protein